ncbi:glutamate racemase [Paenibacillus sp. FSL W7-1287]|uniref:glutamate racemase n=1 Tax=Paenibacillus sp. FSL W7-1287 TaxID=2954538 RepID=UPI0030FB78A7
MQRPIAVLDSGVGGLTVVKELLKQLPQEMIVYYGDTARAPYGPRPTEEVVSFTEEIVNKLLRYDPKLIIIACNTATAAALDKLKRSLNVPIIGVIEPGAKAALQATQTGYIGVIGTEGTIKSKAYDQALLAYTKDIQIVTQACPAFVPLVEKREYHSTKAYHVVYEAIGHMRSYPIDCLILGCTHYPFLADTIAEVMGENVRLIHSAEETARQAQKLVAENEAEDQAKAIIHGSTKIIHHFLCSGNVDSFQAIVEEWLAAELGARKRTYSRVDHSA